MIINGEISRGRRYHAAFFLLAGPNGSGKTTIAPHLISRIGVYLNADIYAKKLIEAGVTSPDIEAGRILLRDWDALERKRADFTVETTLASRSFIPHIKEMQKVGYRFHLIFLWIPNPEIAIERVTERTLHGGHYIPESVIRRRYVAGLRNFFTLYRPIANTWRIFDNSASALPNLIAKGSLKVQKEELWNQIKSQWI